MCLLRVWLPFFKSPLMVKDTSYISYYSDGLYLKSVVQSLFFLRVSGEINY